MTDETNTNEQQTGQQLPTGQPADQSTAATSDQTPPTNQEGSTTGSESADVAAGSQTEDQKPPQEDGLTDEQKATNAALAERAAILDGENAEQKAQDAELKAALDGAELQDEQELDHPPGKPYLKDPVAAENEVQKHLQSKAAAHNVATEIETQIETMLGNATAAAKGWLKAKLWEIKQHLK